LAEPPSDTSLRAEPRPAWKNFSVIAVADDTATSLNSRGFPAPRATRGEVLQLLAKKRPLVMGVLNVTPDSFSDGGRFLDPAAALSQARRLVAEGADIVDVGAESTRPYGGAIPVSLEDERARLAPVLAQVIGLGVPVSIDTLKARVAAWALDLGAAMVNDVWGLQRDPDMAGIVAERGAVLVIMHNRETADPAIDIVAEVTTFFQRSLDIAAHAGIRREQIVLDPGIGFGKTPEQSITCIARLEAWRSFGLPLLVGASRKRFIHSLTPSEPGDRLGGSLAAHLLAVENGAAIVRAHDVGPTLQALTVAAAIRRAHG
jgi:dihydropteroate synthase